MGSPTVPVDEATRAVLATAVINGLHVTIPGRLSTAAYAAVKKALELLGGPWNRRAQAHVFTADPAPLLAAAVADGRVPAPPRTTDGFVRTPPTVARQVVDLARIADLPAGAAVLEPSAGDGALVAAILAANSDVRVRAVEPNEERAANIPRDERVTVHAVTVEEYTAGQVGRCDVVAMNPPFSTPGQPVLWMDHVRLVWDLLAPGGRLVSIVPDNIGWRQDRRHTQMRAWIEERGGWRPLPAGAFGESGTEFGTALLWADKPAGQSSAPAYVFRAYTGQEVPVRVAEPQLGAGAPPVQIWHSVWSGDVVLRLWGRCAVCPRLVWGFDGADNDVRGPLGWNGGGWSLDPFEYEATGPRIALCVRCADSGDTHAKGVAVAWRHWTPNPGEGRSAEPAASGEPVQLTLVDLP